MHIHAFFEYLLYFEHVFLVDVDEEHLLLLRDEIRDRDEFAYSCEILSELVALQI